VDEALYAAKNAGRNCLRLWGQADPGPADPAAPAEPPAPADVPAPRAAAV